MRVLVTGGAGFIGSHFVKRLVAGGDDVVVLDLLTYAGNPANLEGTGVELVEGDIADPEAVARAGSGCDAIVNFAAETHVDRSILGPKAFVHTDVLGTMTLLEWARSTGARYVQVSTDEVYGDLEAGGRALEDDPQAVEPVQRRQGRRRSPGARVRAHVRRRRLHHPWREHLRTEPVSREARSPVRHECARRRAAPVYGDGKQVREWLHAEDHCAGIELVLREGAPGEIYNIGGEDHENLEVTHRILELTGAPAGLLRHVEDRAGHDRRYAVDDAKLRALGWSPERSFGEGGLRETVEWYRANRAWWEPIKSGEYRRYYEEQYAERLEA